MDSAYPSAGVRAHRLARVFKIVVDGKRTVQLTRKTCVPFVVRLVGVGVVLCVKRVPDAFSHVFLHRFVTQRTGFGRSIAFSHGSVPVKRVAAVVQFGHNESAHTLIVVHLAHVLGRHRGLVFLAQGQFSVAPPTGTMPHVRFDPGLHHSLVNGAATNTLHWWSGELTASYLAMQVALGFNTEREAGVAFFVVF